MTRFVGHLGAVVSSLLVVLVAGSCGETDAPPGGGEGEGEGEGGEGEGEGGEGEGEDPCAQIRCPPQSTCVEGACHTADPCETVECDAGFVCSSGACFEAGTDRDLDGYPVEVDCDDSDPGVFPGSTVPCATECGQGTSTCVDGHWTECTAPTECTCSPGETRTEPCGLCGRLVRSCGADGEWEDTVECVGEGECSPGATELQACGDCGTATRACDADCRWGAWGECSAAGVCSPGDVEGRACGSCGAQQRTCIDACEWSPWSVCAGEGACAPGATETADCADGGTQSRTCDVACAWGPWSSCPGVVDECALDSDCVAATCCHASDCVPAAQAPNCIGVLCTDDCRPGTMDCGAGYCACQQSTCVAVINGGAI